MKKIVLALFASTCALGACAYETLVDGNTTYTYAPLSGDVVELVSAAPKLQGPELDLAVVQKLFSSENLRIAQLANLDNIVEDKEAITSVVLPEYMENRMNVSDLLSLPNVESAFGGSGAITTIDGIAYADGGRVLVRCPKAHAGAVKLPSNCRQILAYAFAGCRNLTGVSGGADVLRVGSCAFGDLYDGDDVASFIANRPDGVVMVGHAVIGWKGNNVPSAIELPAGATSVAASAFPDTVTNVTGGLSVKWVGVNAFEGFVDASPSGELVMIGDVLIGCGHHGDIVSTLTPPANTVAIAPSAFWFMDAIVELDFAGLDNLEVIGDNAFYGCSGLERVDLPDGVKEIQDCAFQSCDRLREFTFGAATEALGWGVFDSCSKLEDVYFRCEKAPREDCDPVYDFRSAFYAGTPDSLTTHVTPNSTGWNLDDYGKWCLRNFDRKLKRKAITGYVGYYDKWTLAELGVPVPPAGTVYTAVAYGLPKGLVLKCNVARKKKGKVVTPAKVSWWIEGVPTTTLDRDTQTAFVKTTVNGVSTLHPLDLEVREQTILDYDFNLKEFVVKKPGEYGLGKGWVISNLPKGLKQTNKAIKVKVGRKTYSVPAYGIYGAPTEPGNRIVVTKKKTGSWYEVQKYRYRVLNADGTPVEDDPIGSRPSVWLEFNDYDGTKTQTIQGGLRKDGGKSVIKTFSSQPGATLKLVGAPASLSLEKVSEGSTEDVWRLVGFALPGDYHVSVVATLDGFDDVRQSIILHSDALPDWATGSFSGYVAGSDDEAILWGYFTMSVTAKGAISGKLDRDGESYSFTADSYAASDDRSFSVTNIVLKQSVAKRVYDKKKKKWITGTVLEDTDDRLDIKVEQGVAGVLKAYMYSVEEPGDGDWIVAQQNRWGNTYKSIGTALFTASAKQKYKTFAINNGYDLPDGASLSFKITPSGSVTVTGKFPSGWKTVTVKGRKQRVRTYDKPVRSTMLIPETHPDVGVAGFRGRIAVYLPYKSDGKSKEYTHIFEFPFEVEGTSWFTGEFNTPAYVATLTRFGASSPQAAAPYDITYGTCNIKVKESMAFTGTFTPAGIEAAVSFSGTFKGVESEEQGATGTSVVTNQYVATASIVWKGWAIPFALTLEKDMFGNWEVGRLTFNTYSPDQSAPEAVFASAEDVADNAIGGQLAKPAMQEFWRWRRYEPDGMHHLGNIWPDGILHDEPAVLVSGDMIEWDVKDWLVYRFRSNGSVSIDGVIGGQAVKTSSVVQFIDWANSGYSGCFFVNLGAAGLFVQKCNIGISESECANVTTGNTPLAFVWRTPDE